jgi:hypothetical protein
VANTSLDATLNVPIKTALGRRYQQLRRSLLRGNLKRKPTVAEAVALNRAAALTLRAEAALHDPTVTANDLVRLDRLATAARRACADLIRAGTRPKVSTADWLHMGSKR